MAVYGMIGEDLVSGDIQDWEIQLEAFKVGRWKILLKNVANKWGGDFHTNDVVEIKESAVPLLKGYVDDVIPQLDKQGVYTNVLKIIGRDNARDLARLKITMKYANAKADNVFDDLLSQTGSEITYTSPDAAPIININRTRTYLIDWLKDIIRELPAHNYDAYVDLDKAFHFFVAGHVDEVSGVALKSVAGELDNNILDLQKGEEIGFSIVNHVEFSAGSLKDHYSDMNAPDFAKGTGTTCVNWTIDDASPAEVHAGMAALKFSSVADITTLLIYLDFTDAGTRATYSRTALDLSKPDEMSYYVWHTGAGPAWPYDVRPFMIDNDGNEIEFRRTGTLSLLQQLVGMDLRKGYTISLARTFANRMKVQVPIGDSENNTIATDPQDDDTWVYKTKVTTFDWSNIKKIGFKHWNTTTGARSVFIDNWCIPSLEVISIQYDQDSIDSYDKSMYSDTRTDLKSQIELNAHTLGYLNAHKDPLKTIRIIAIGQTASKYTGQSVTVQAPGHGIADATKYRIFKLFHRGSLKPILKGHCFITIYDLAKHEMSPTAQVVDTLRFGLLRDPLGTAIEALAIARRRLSGAQTTQEYVEFGDTHPSPTPVFVDPDTPSGFDATDIATGYSLVSEDYSYVYFVVTVPTVTDAIGYGVRYRIKTPQSDWIVKRIFGSNVVRIIPVLSNTLYEFQACAYGDLNTSSDWTSTVEKTSATDPYTKILDTYTDAGTALIKVLNQITNDLITIGKILDWYVGTSAPGSPNVGMIWLDTSESPPQQKRWDGSNWVRMDVITLIEMIGDLDDVDDGSSYGKLLLTQMSAGKVLLAQVEGDFDDIDDGSTYGKVLLTSISAGAIILAQCSGDLDDILEGTTFGKVKLTALSAGEILLAQTVGDLDDIDEGSTYGKVLITAISAGKILVGQLEGNMDDMVDGTTYARMLKMWRHPLDATYIDGGKLYTDTVDARVLKSNEVMTGHLQADAVTAPKISVTELSSINPALGTITSGYVSGTDLRVGTDYGLYESTSLVRIRLLATGAPQIIMYYNAAIGFTFNVATKNAFANNWYQFSPKIPTDIEEMRKELSKQVTKSHRTTPRNAKGSLQCEVCDKPFHVMKWINKNKNIMNPDWEPCCEDSSHWDAFKDKYAKSAGRMSMINSNVLADVLARVEALEGG